MNKHIIIRWVLFFILSLPIQFIVYILYPFAIIYFKLFIKPKIENNIKPLSYNPTGNLNDLINKSKSDKKRDIYFLDNQDDHGALTHIHWGLDHSKNLAEKGLELLLDKNGTVHRKAPNYKSYNISIDVVSAWVFNYIISGTKKPDLINRLAKHYLKYCLGIDNYGQGVSNRSSSSGVNYTKDGKYNLDYPSFGLEYYTSAAIFALAIRENKGFKKIGWGVVYWIHYFIMGGWIWKYQPIMHTVKQKDYYMHHITAMNLYSISKCLVPHNKELKRLMDLTSPNKNPFMYALYLNIGGHPSIIDTRLAVKGLLSMQGDSVFVWQRYPSGPNYFNAGPRTFYSHLAFVAKLLKPFNK